MDCNISLMIGGATTAYAIVDEIKQPPLLASFRNKLKSDSYIKEEIGVITFIIHLII